MLELTSISNFPSPALDNILARLGSDEPGLVTDIDRIE
jgi:hypothetical protein